MNASASAVDSSCSGQRQLPRPAARRAPRAALGRRERSRRRICGCAHRRLLGEPRRDGRALLSRLMGGRGRALSLRPRRSAIGRSCSRRPTARSGRKRLPRSVTPRAKERATHGATSSSSRSSKRRRGSARDRGARRGRSSARRARRRARRRDVSRRRRSRGRARRGWSAGPPRTSSA